MLILIYLFTLVTRRVAFAFCLWCVPLACKTLDLERCNIYSNSH